MGERLVIEPGRAGQHYFRDLWRYRELFYFLAWRDLLVRYKQTTIGVAWAVLRPLLAMIVFSLVFGHMARLPSEGVPYPLLVLAGMLPWQFFANALSGAGASLVGSAHLVSKVYFPRLVIPASSVMTSVVDFAVSLVIVLALLAWYEMLPSPRLLVLPAFAVLALLAALGPGLFASALTARYRDFRHVSPFLLQFGLYVSPVGFSSSVVPEKWRLLYSANPMVGVIDGFRWAICGTGTLYWPGFALSSAVAVAFLWLGFAYFRRVERNLSDLM